MTPLKFTITGALGIRAGLNRDQFSMDLTKIPDEAVAVYIRGDNGVGKSTLLNLAFTPWREPASINGNIYDRFGPTGQRDLEWSHHGEQYRSVITYRQTAKTKSTKAILHVMREGEWAAYVAPDNTVSDGKASTYDHCLESILGPRDLYYLSAFCGQNASLLAEHDDPKSLMHALLSLDRYVDLAELAQQVQRGIKAARDTLRESIPSELDLEREIAMLNAGIEEMERELPKVEEQILILQADDAKLVSRLQDAADKDREADHVQEQRKALQAMIDEIKAGTEAAAAAFEKELEQQRNLIRESRRKLRQTLGGIEADKGKAVKDMERWESLLASADDVRAAVGQIPELEESYEAAKINLADAQAWCDKIDEATRQKDLLVADELRFISERQHQEKILEDLTKRSRFITEVPCQGVGRYAQCPALKDAREACEALPSQEHKVRDADAKSKEVAAEAAKLLIVVSDKDAAHIAREKSNFGLEASHFALSNARELEGKLGSLNTAEESLCGTKAHLEELAKRATNANREQAAMEASIGTEAAKIKTAHDKVVAESRTKIDGVQKQIDMLPVPGSTTHKDRITAEIRSLRARIKVDEDNRARMTSKIASHRQVIDERMTERDGLKARQDKVDALNDEISNWVLLRHALKGIIDLSIEDAGPTIATLTNELLKQAYGPRFSVRIVTQRQQANGRLVECFEISIIDNESGLESSILHKSGGECIWLDKALTDAVGLYHQQVSGVDYETLIADEAEDGLTQERKTMFYKMDRAMLERGGYRRKYCVSHNPEAWALADYVINLDEHRRER